MKKDFIPPPCYSKLIYQQKAGKIADFLISQEWRTRPGMNMCWILRNSPDLYYLYLEDFDFNEEIIGFMVIDRERKTLYYFEILPQYRNKKYGTKIINRMIDDFEFNKVYCDEETVEFWRDMLYVDEECSSFDSKDGLLTLL